MFRRFSVNFALFSMVLDGLCVCLMLAVAVALRPKLGFLPFAEEYPQIVPIPWIVYLIFAFEWVAVFSLFSVYDGRRNRRWIDEFASLTLGSLLAAMALAGTLYVSYREVSRLLFASFVLMTYLSMLGWRGLSRAFIGVFGPFSGQQRRVLILSGSPAGLELYHQIQADNRSGLRVVELIEVQPGEGKQAAANLLEILGQKIREHKLEDIVVALPQEDYERTNTIVGYLHQYPVKIWLIPDYFRLALHKAAVEEFGGIAMLDLRAPALSDSQRLIKRAFDLIVALLSVPVGILIGVLIGLAIRLETPGPILFSQMRIGENGRLFKMYKFRSMKHDAESVRRTVEKVDEQGRLLHKNADDPRVTRIGKFLRRTSLDEIPQLYNVIKGEMSLVGPRPELPYLVDRYETWQRKRFAAPQGITGWWQINGRSDRPMHLHTEDDLYYIQHYSLLLDIYILLKTFAVVIQGKGAF